MKKIIKKEKNKEKINIFKVLKNNKFYIFLLIFNIILFSLTKNSIVQKLFTKEIIKNAYNLFWIGLNIVMLLPTLIRIILRKKKTPMKAENKKKIIKITLFSILSLIIITLVAVIIFMSMIMKTAPEFDPKKLYKSESTVVYDKDGNIFTTIGSEKREIITYGEMSENLVNAIVATEDSRFFSHNGFDLPRFLVASFNQVIGRDAGGASTLTMQVVKNTYTSTVSSGMDGIKRKFTDIYMSIFKVEKSYTKNEILEFYANSYYLGGGAYGVEQASRNYFNKSAKDLTLPEAAMIAGLFNAPVMLDPYNHPDRAEERRLTVLYLMKRHGYINDEQYEMAKKITVDKMVTVNAVGGDYQGFLDTVVAEVQEKTGANPYAVPMEIYTTMDRSKQDFINDIMNGKTYDWENDKVQAGIVVVDNQTGAIAAIGAGRNKTAEQSSTFNFATMSKRQIGSTAKPFYDYMPAIEVNNLSPYTLMVDESYSYSDGNKFYNWDDQYKGLMSARYALADSRNVTAVKVFQATDNRTITNLVQKLGLNPESNNGYIHEAHAMGGYTGESPLTLAGAFQAFGNGGYYIKPYSITKIKYRDNKEEWDNKYQKVRAMSEETAYMVYDMLKTTKNLNLDIYVDCGAKTGTTNFEYDVIRAHPQWPRNAINDLWVGGVNSKYSIALWYGYDKIYDEYVSRFGVHPNKHIFTKVAREIFTRDGDVKKPDNVVQVTVEKETNPPMLPSANTPENMKVTELFKKGLEPTEVSKRFDKLPNPTNGTSTYNNGNIVLNWKAVELPSIHTREGIEKSIGILFKGQEERNKIVDNMLNYNNVNIGDLGYNIYTVEDGETTFVAFTKENTYKYNSANTDTTFIIKSAYSILGSSGEGITINHQGNGEVIITSSLVGNNYKIKIGEEYKPNEQEVIVKENNKDVTSKANITTVIKDKTNKVVTEIDTTKVNKYTISYTVTYKTYTKTYTRTIEIIE